MKNKTLSIGLIILLSAFTVVAQTTEFTYQGQLQSSSAPANGSFDFEFLLFDALSGGTQIGSTLTRSSVAVANGIFSVKLDFGSNFPGANRFLEIHVVQTGGGAFIPLTPRQAVSSAPYSVKSLNADTATNAVNATNATNAINATTATNANQLGGVPASGYLQTNGNGSGLTNLNASSITTGTLDNARLGQIPTANIADSAVTSQKIATGQVVKSLNTLTDNVTLAAGSNISITPTGNTLTIASTGGSGGGIQNQTTLQTGANFNIDGTGTANILNAQTQYNLGGGRVLSSPGLNNLFAGLGAGTSNTTGANNNFFAQRAGLSNTTGNFNNFVGREAGTFNTTGSFNNFFGDQAGFANTMADGNSFFGDSAGTQNTIGVNNSFFGQGPGYSNLNGIDNAFFGGSAGRINVSGSANSFFGVSAGFNNIADANSFFGRSAGFQNTTGIRNSFFGLQAGRDSTGSNNSFFGYQAGLSNGSGGLNNFFGAQAGLINGSGTANNFFGDMAGFNNTGSQNSFFGDVAGGGNTSGSNNTVIGADANVGSGNLTNATAIGAFAVVTASSRVQIGRITQDTVAIGAFGTPSTSTHVCIDSNGVFTACASSLRYKENVQPFSQGLPVIKRLRPVTFNWKEGHGADLGLIAEEVNAIEPLLNNYNRNGEVEGVKYEQLTIVLVNAVKEQQEQIETQQKQITQQQNTARQQQAQVSEQQREIQSLRRLVCAGRRKAAVCRSSH